MAMHIQTTIELSNRFTKTDSYQPLAVVSWDSRNVPDDIHDPRRHNQTRGRFMYK